MCPCSCTHTFSAPRRSMRLFVRSGESESGASHQALAEIVQSKQLNPSFQPSPRAFSPRFVNLYQTGGAASSQPAGAAATQ